MVEINKSEQGIKAPHTYEIDSPIGVINCQ